VKELLANDAPAAYASPGWLLFVRNGALMAQAFDADHLELRGAMKSTRNRSRLTESWAAIRRASPLTAAITPASGAMGRNCFMSPPMGR
jgi:hypothetical protein